VLRLAVSIVCRRMFLAVLFYASSTFAISTSDSVVVSEEVCVWSCRQHVNVTVSISVKHLWEKLEHGTMWCGGGKQSWGCIRLWYYLTNQIWGIRVRSGQAEMNGFGVEPARILAEISMPVPQWQCWSIQHRRKMVKRCTCASFDQPFSLYWEGVTSPWQTDSIDRH
jgi:hypothetical protein